MSSKSDIKMLKALSEYTHETIKELKRSWAAVPAKDKARDRRKIQASITEFKARQVERAKHFKELPTSL